MYTSQNYAAEIAAKACPSLLESFLEKLKEKLPVPDGMEVNSKEGTAAVFYRYASEILEANMPNERILVNLDNKGKFYEAETIRLNTLQKAGMVLIYLIIQEAGCWLQDNIVNMSPEGELLGMEIKRAQHDWKQTNYL